MAIDGSMCKILTGKETGETGVHNLWNNICSVLAVLENQHIGKKKKSLSDLQGVCQLLQNGSGQPVPVQRQRLQVRQGGQRGQEQEERLVRQLGEAQLQADHGGGVTLQVRTQTLHVAGG